MPCGQLLGSERVARLGADEFIIQGSGSDILIVGERPNGTLYAVYSFLEQKLGCRWLNCYGEEFVPVRKFVLLNDIDRTFAPPFDQHYGEINVRNFLNTTHNNEIRRLSRQPEGRFEPITAVRAVMPGDG